MAISFKNTPTGVTPKRTDIEFEGVKVAEINEDGIVGSGVSFDPTGTGLVSTNMQDAVVEVSEKSSSVITLTGQDSIVDGIPAGVTKVSLTLNGASMTSTSPITLRLGDSVSVKSTGYNTVVSSLGASGINSNQEATGIPIITTGNMAASTVLYGWIDFRLSDGVWFYRGSFEDSSSILQTQVTGALALATDLTRIRITSLAGAGPAFDAGTAQGFWS